MRGSGPPTSQPPHSSGAMYFQQQYQAPPHDGQFDGKHYDQQPQYGYDPRMQRYQSYDESNGNPNTASFPIHGVNDGYDQIPQQYRGGENAGPNFNRQQIPPQNYPPQMYGGPSQPPPHVYQGGGGGPPHMIPPQGFGGAQNFPRGPPNMGGPPAGQQQQQQQQQFHIVGAAQPMYAPGMTQLVLNPGLMQPTQLYMPYPCGVVTKANPSPSASSEKEKPKRGGKYGSQQSLDTAQQEPTESQQQAQQQYEMAQQQQYNQRMMGPPQQFGGPQQYGHPQMYPNQGPPPPPPHMIPPNQMNQFAAAQQQFQQQQRGGFPPNHQANRGGFQQAPPQQQQQQQSPFYGGGQQVGRGGGMRGGGNNGRGGSVRGGWPNNQHSRQNSGQYSQQQQQYGNYQQNYRQNYQGQGGHHNPNYSSQQQYDNNTVDDDVAHLTNRIEHLEPAISRSGSPVKQVLQLIESPPKNVVEPQKIEPEKSEEEVDSTTKHEAENAEKSGSAKLFCYKCDQMKMPKEQVESHSIRKPDGKAWCPVLREEVCPICQKTGDDAHSPMMCPSVTASEPQDSQNSTRDSSAQREEVGATEPPASTTKSEQVPPDSSTTNTSHNTHHQQRQQRRGGFGGNNNNMNRGGGNRGGGGHREVEHFKIRRII
ncbi:unnamed protein product [Caenorhabditis angaria]|uniref:Nanos-type domain-containing protein n=1 Tax=Caenorhabditis angaria TaxID=860376 RepID=A0A9P1I989_9PELO|nr:unnamed protein product [Caenorhabditis angaria]